MDWKNKIIELIATGMTQAQIAQESGVSQPTIAGLVAGDQRDMRWANGHRLLALHRRVMRAKKTPDAKEVAHD
ncbi:helix-turn-helix domain-containing protein [Pusillimonas sp. ANT_WB101]|uniref:helix-turn-helix domain-containing protein n=1 Tax=Pusillimonas sp. ANT_WB101 TaxID=2597356 RepID=UPI0011EE5B58|nr:helix-turn-helix domain-containing protein [Pusillimonas sp. ANT_WB101]KAA0910659.1 hypothetical protein FQ179_01925 [Pusillimonas sp. ANT_WB101]